MRIALVSLNQKWMDKKANLARCAFFVAEAKALGCELVVFPELTLTSYSLDIHSIAELEQESVTLSEFGILAKKTGLSIIFGACLIGQDEILPSNMFCLALPDGTSKSIYSKIHPFSFAGEDKVLQAGSQVASAKIGMLEFGASICYDLRFPELYSAMAPICNAAIVIANWPMKRVAHWRTLLIARAIENQFFMFGINRTGSDGNGLVYEKSTLAVSPDGFLQNPLVQGEEMDVYDIDIKNTASYRANFPTLRNKRYALYRNFFESLVNVE